MTQLYLAKTITLPSTGIVITTWVINNWRVRNNADPTKVLLTVSVVGYMTTAALSSGLNSIPGARFVYRLTAANFPTGTDLTSVSLTDMYNAILNYTSSTTDSLTGAVLTTL